MQNTSVIGMEPEIIARRDQALAKIFQGRGRVWLVAESYNAVATTWQVDVVNKGSQGQWLRRRYHYDVPKEVVYFFGARPLSEAEFAKLRQTSRLLDGYLA